MRVGLVGAVVGATHAFVGIGPALIQDVIRSNDNEPNDVLGTHVGGAVTIGGWL